MRSHLFLLALVGFAPAATAGTVRFTGSYANQNPPASLEGRCAPAARTVSFGPGIAPVSGSSNLGAFVPSGSHCINPPLPTSYFDGLFAFDFGGGDVLSGAYSGVLAATDSPGAFSNTQDFVITGGTGRFMGASGAFQGLGTVTFAPGALPSSFQTFTGMLSASAVPGPASAGLLAWAGAIMLAARRKAARKPRR